MNDLTKQFYDITEKYISADEALAIIEYSDSPQMQKSLARSMVLNGDSMVGGRVYPLRFANTLADKISFWQEMKSRSYDAKSWSYFWR